jgi:hypothetical protein
VKKLLGNNQSSSTTKKRAKVSAEEAEMLALDKTLSELLSSAPASALSTDGGKAPAPVQVNTPLPIRRALEAARLKRAQAQAEQDRQSGVVRAKPSTGDIARPALTKRKFREESGQEDRRRKGARGIGGAVGRWAAGKLSLSREEIETGGEGKKRRPGGKGGYDGTSSGGRGGPRKGKSGKRRR